MKYSECIDWELGIDHQIVLIDRCRRIDEKHDREKEKYYHKGLIPSTTVYRF